MSQTLAVLHHVEYTCRFVIAQLTLNRLATVLIVDEVHLVLFEQLRNVYELNLHALVPDVLRVTVELLNRVGVIVAAVALQLSDVVIVVGRCGVDDIFKLVIVPWTTCARRDY